VHVALWHEALEPDPVQRLGLLGTWVREFPDTAVVLTADRLTPPYTLTALRGGASEIVRRSADGDELATVVRHAHRTHAARHGGAQGQRPRMLVVGAHPDDAEIGVGGLIHRRLRDGWDITVLVMSHGSFGGNPDRRSDEARHAAAPRRCSAPPSIWPISPTGTSPTPRRPCKTSSAWWRGCHPTWCSSTPSTTPTRTTVAPARSAVPSALAAPWVHRSVRCA
jgi:hypothetical protein